MAGKRIKGLTIEIDGNTTKLQTALKTVDGQLSKTQTSLRDVNRLLKLDPHNTDLLGQKQRLLAESINKTKERLETLKTAEKQAQQAFAEGKISQEQYEALQREIVDTENKLKSLKKAAGSSFETFNTKAQEVSEKVGNVGDELMPVSAAATAVSVASGKMAVDFEDSMAHINTLLSDTKNLDGYEEAIKNMSSETGIALEVVSAGMYQTISSIGDGGKETEKIFNTMGTAAKAGGAEVSDSVALISAGMKGYNSVNDETAKKISDLAFQTAKLGVTTFPEMARSMQPLFPLSSSLNLSYEELFGTMATLTGVTGNTSEVTTQLKAVFSNLMKPTGAMTALMQKYGYESGAAMIQSEGFQGVLSILQKETGGQSDQLAKLFSSTEALTAATALTGPQFDVFGEKLNEMQNSTGATSAAYDKMATSGDNLRQTWNDIKIAGVELGTMLLETLGPVIEIISSKVKAFSKWFGGLSENQKKVISTITLLLVAMGPMLKIVSKGISLVGHIAGGIGKLTGLLSKVGGAGKIAGLGVKLFSGPVGIAIGIVGGLVAAGVLLYKNWDKIKAKASQLKASISEAWNNIKSKTVGVWNSVKTTITDKIESAKEKVKSVIDKIKGFFKFDWSLPKLKLPHLSITGKLGIAPPQVPKFDIKWYKKAMNKAYMLKNASIFGTMGGKLLGGGESGNEMVVGQRHLLEMINKASNSSALIEAYTRGNNQIISLLTQYLPVLASQSIVLDSGELVGAMTPAINANLSNHNMMGRMGII